MQTKFRLAVMIFVLLTLSLYLISLYTATDWEQCSDDFLALLVSEQFDQVFQLFDIKMQNDIPEQNLHEIWQDLEKGYGKFQDLTEKNIILQEDMARIQTLARFERGKLQLGLLMNRQGLVSGLWFKPLENSDQLGPGKANQDAAKENGALFITYLLEKKYDEAFGMFGEKMKVSMHKSQMTRIWQEKIKSLASFKEIVDQKISVRGAYLVVDNRCKFTKGDIAVRLVLSDVGEVTGFWFLEVKI